ncbi:MAG: lamin tail domain-containing protein [Anaerolineae bacterium]|nr:lamin tail domain-containing protein [Anaerolineae bacterium]
MQWKRLSYYLLLNIIVSVATTLIVLTLWERTHQNEFDRVAAEAVLPATAAVALETVAEPTLEPPQALLAHQVRAGETLGDIALEYDVAVEELLEINGLTDADAIGAGLVIYVPDPDVTPLSATVVPAVEEAQGSVEIVSVLAVGDLATERVVLGDAGGEKVSLAGWQLGDEDENLYTLPQATLYENGQIVIYSRTDVDNPLELFWGAAEAIWQSGEIVTLYDAAGNVHTNYQVP